MMKTSMQTLRLSTPPIVPLPNPKRLSRTSSSLSSSSHTIHRLSCAPDDSSQLSMALSTNKPAPVAVYHLHKAQHPDNHNERDDDHLYEEISPAKIMPPSNNGTNNKAAPLQHQLISSSPSNSIPLSAVDPPKLAPVSGVLHNKGAALIRPIAFKPYVRNPVDGGAASLTSPKTPLSHTSSASISSNNPSSSFPAADHRRVTTLDKHESALLLNNQSRNNKPTGRSLSDPWKGNVHRKPNAGDYSSSKSRSTPSSIREDSSAGQMVYYPSSSDKSSYGYVSCSDQSAESLYGAHKTYKARMINIRSGDEDEANYAFDPYHITSTPSPSDSGIVVNYEALLRERDNEILTLRTTMELNEGVIFKVHEEKEASWKKQNDKMKDSFEMQLQKLSSEHLNRQNELTRTIDQLRQQNLKLHQQVHDAMECKSTMESSIEDLEQKCQEKQTRLDQATWSLNERSLNEKTSLVKKNRSSISDQAAFNLQLQQKLENAQKEALQRNAELQDLRQTLNFLSQELYQVQQKFDATREELEQKKELRNNKRSSLLLVGNSELSLCDQGEMDRLRKELTELRGKFNVEKRVMEEERASWFEEKEKVIKYQKQLQLNYLEVYKRNCSLETELDDVNASFRINGLDCLQDRPDSVRESDC